MSNVFRQLCGGLLLLTVGFAAMAQSSSGVPVTPDNFVRAESDLYFGNIVKDGGFGKFLHHRQPAPIDNQAVIRLNRDTLYSAAVFDLDAGPVTITLPDPGKRFMSMQVIDEDQYTPQVTYGSGSHTLSKEKIGTRYVLLGIRTLVDPSDPKDVAAVHALQDSIKADQPGGPGKFEAPSWDHVSQGKVREALLVLASTMPDTTSLKRGFSTLSRRSTSPSISGTPALESCSRWKQKLMRSWRGILRPPIRRERLLEGAPVTRSSPMRARRCSRSKTFTASTRPRTFLPLASMAL